MNNWNGLDFFVFLILALNTIRGMSRGAAKELIALMCLSAALIFCIKFTVPVTNFMISSPTLSAVLESKFIENFFQSIGAGPLTADFLSQVSYSISLLICFVSVFSVTEACLIYSGVSESLSFSQALVSRKLGSAIGFIRGYIISLIFLSILSLHLYNTDENVPGSKFISGSFFVNLFSSQVKMLDNMIGSQEVEKYHELYQNAPINEKDILKQLSYPDDEEKKDQPIKKSELEPPTFDVPY